MWTRFRDVGSGGGLKEPPYKRIFIEACVDEAISIFKNRFGHNPNNVTCRCCGEDYAVEEHETLEQATGHERRCAWDGQKYIEEPYPPRRGHDPHYQRLEEYLNSDEVLVVYAHQIQGTDDD